MAVNGALIGALGPSLSDISHATGLDDAALGKVVFQNRLCKLVGNFVWCFYARTLQRDGGFGRPHAVFAGLLLVTCSSAFIIGASSNPDMVRFALLAWGWAYGTTDAGVTSLTVWRWTHDNRRRRIDLAMLNAGFTVGAVVAPAIVAASIRYGGGRWAFRAIGGSALLVGMLMCRVPPSPLPLSPSERADQDGEGDDDKPRQRLLLGYLEGVAARERRHKASYELCFVAAMSTVLCCVTGCEHGLATWLSPFGIEHGGLSAQRMALMSSLYWGVMCGGRVAWACMSGWVSSTWPMLLFDVTTSLCASVLLLLCKAFPDAFEGLLWLSAMGLGLGVSSALPCVYSLPPEAKVAMTPWAIAVLNAASTLGETCFPYVIGLAFERKIYVLLGGLLTVSMVLALGVAVAARRAASRFGASRRLYSELEFS